MTRRIELTIGAATGLVIATAAWATVPAEQPTPMREFEIKNVFVDIVQEFSHPEGMDKDIFREPDGTAKKAKLTAWFKAVAPDIEVGVCPDASSGTGDSYPSVDVRLIQKAMPIPNEGFVVNVETQRHTPTEGTLPQNTLPQTRTLTA